MIEKLTPGEKLLIEKRRQGFTQKQMAASKGVSLSTYGRWERDTVEPECKLLALTPRLISGSERCVLYRRRAGKTQEEVAKELKTCRWRLNLMEQGLVPCDDLIWFWEQ